MRSSCEHVEWAASALVQSSSQKEYENEYEYVCLCNSAVPMCAPDFRAAAAAPDADAERNRGGVLAKVGHRPGGRHVDALGGGADAEVRCGRGAELVFALAGRLVAAH